MCVFVCVCLCARVWVCVFLYLRLSRNVYYIPLGEEKTTVDVDITRYDLHIYIYTFYTFIHLYIYTCYSIILYIYH